ncbi:type II toxin-antitoxin system HipA family toxin [Halomonas huangheensis]|uniref:HipA-like C-terminal domain-containing protein n=1 Tax=Halomonas huangheensis TaxID=1178482 RepID=W1NCZ6_9GAMM|nr:HipA domain-containing protein [Halomonas huangheensis]ALM52654.1 toxin HipA [Halomonas huangheensis]ERL52825.1 hypothetical protein BJB45_16230 [Halomonas huangheensis]
MKLTVQIHLEHCWQDAATLMFDDPDSGVRGPCKLGYHQEHALAWMFRDDHHACSLNLPVELMYSHHSDHWFGFLEDIMPSGASRRYWVNQLGLQRMSSAQQDSVLLRHGTIAPVGNLRIRESLPETRSDNLSKQRFTVSDVIERQVDFLEYAQQMGAASGGATGAGGEAPKLLIRRSSSDEVWIDTWQEDNVLLDSPYLVKFPRGQRRTDDCDILRAEYHFYHELEALGLDTIDTGLMQLHEGERYPSLWLPRFDTELTETGRIRHGLETISSLLSAPAAAHLRHESTLRAVLHKMHQQHRVTGQDEPFNSQRFAIEWVKRDLLNIAFGNSDNHGRNTSIIKRPQGMWLAPIYDFAPMKADPEGITRTMQWGPPLEQGGEYDWPGIASALNDLVPEEQLINELQTLASQLTGLRDRLAERGVAQRLLDMPGVGLTSLDTRLQRWGLLP